ncbi:Protein of unknown function [Rhodovulum sp. ES.010]|uniref:DUF2927 domain-containing protein n=1 Tax=Rhodovulum sp. ES.010 TaxID=1882821 RepID=UPI000929B70D|nr:DUF2927 domain-containing protein [Rhodovulum sp. ES.010]SIO56480.1 Protein of unknown function [Rhodovulum sp. ES.010]
MRPRLRAFLTIAPLLGALSACQIAPQQTSLRPAPRPEATAPAPGPSEESRAIARHFARVEADLVARGLLRTDSGGPDVPFSRRTLVENFVRIALYDEYVSRAGQLLARETESRLRRWEQPIRLGIVFGESVSPEQREEDRAEISAYSRRLAGLTGLPIRMSPPEQANFHVFIVDEDERRAIGPRLRTLVPGIDGTAIRTIETIPRSTFCLVLAFSRGDTSTYSRAVAVIRAEHPPRLRQSCIHEELAQGMGLANDSPAARPSIFNDDEEFALLTRHDELLLTILYDRRLRPGMTPRQARPLVESIAAGLVGGES